MVHGVNRDLLRTFAGRYARQPHLFGCEAPHLVLAGHLFGAHVTVAPQLFGTVPQSLPRHAVPSSVQPQTFATPPPPQVFGAEQELGPHETVVPQLFVTLPQFLPLQADPSSEQPHVFGTPPPPQVSGA